MIYTSYFDNVQNIISIYKSDIDFYSIAGYPPKWYKSEYDSRYKCVSALAPKKIWWMEWREKFKDNLNSQESIDFYTKKYYETVLHNINIDAYVNTMRRCSSGNNFCMLCYEKPGDFCHRHILRKYLNENGIKCLEL